MLIAVYFLSLYQAQKMAGRTDTIVASIRDRHYTPKLQAGFRDVLALYFDDYDEARDGINENVDCFEAQHVDALRGWLSPHVASPAPLIFMAHCHAGVSRSAAIAWWVHREFEVPLRTTFPIHYLNREILRSLNPTIVPPAIPEGGPTQAAAAFDRIFNDDDWPRVRETDRKRIWGRAVAVASKSGV